jgi:hypothetical protein
MPPPTDLLPYAQNPPVPTERIERAVCFVGAIHALACIVYLGQRTWRWILGTENQLAETQTTFIANLGLSLQMAAAVVFLLACLSRVCINTRLAKIIVSSALIHAILWMYFGLLDGMWVFTRDYYDSVDKLREFSFNLCREINQAIVPLVIVILFFRQRTTDQMARWVLRGSLLACLMFCIPASIQLARYLPIPNITIRPDPWAKWFAESIGFGLAFFLLLVLRKPWRLIAAAPFLAWITRDLVVNAADRMQRWPTMERHAAILQISREVSFLTVTATACALAFAVFTIVGVPKPRWRKAA